MTVANGRGAEIHLRAIKSHEGSQARAWEELTYQLRPPAGDGHVETRKTRAPDAGVEWYEVYADGHQEGFQAKFHANLQDALSGMRESVAAVCTKRPNLTRLTFVVPYDFTDSGTAGTKTDQDRWDQAVARWRADFPLSSHVGFTTIRAGDITAKLTLKEHAGRREYWFGGLEITDEWLKKRFAESVRVAGERYTPQADSPSSINAIIDAVSSGTTFLAELRSLNSRASAACRQDTGMWGASAAPASSLIDDLDEGRASSFGTIDGGDDVLPHDAPNLARMQVTANKLLDLAYTEWENLPSSDRRNLDAAISALQAHHGRNDEDSEPAEQLTDSDPLGGGATSTGSAGVDKPAELKPAPELFQGHLEYLEGQRGVSFDSLLISYLRDATQITIVDPYVRMFHQARNLMELVEGIARGKEPADEVTIKLVTVENQDGREKAERQLEYLLQIKKSAGVLGIVFDVELVDPSAIHDRSITTDTGWKILLGRGLDIFQRVSDSPFDLATKNQKYRELKAFGVTYIREHGKG